MNVRDAVRGLVSARAEVDDWDHDFTPAPYHLYTAALEALETVPLAEREGVLALLAAPDADVRREAANACAHWCLSAARAALVAGLADPVSKVRDAMGSALIAVERETALGTLAASAAQVSNSVRKQAIEAAMEALGSAVLPLVERVDYAPEATNPKDDVWQRLYELDPRAAGEVLERRVASGRFDWVYGAQGLLRTHSGGSWVRPVFMKLVDHPDPPIARIAAEVLEQFGDASAIEPLLISARTATHPWQRQAAIRSALELGAKTHTPVLTALRPLLSNDTAIQELLMEALAGFRGNTAEPPALIETLVRAGLQHQEEKVAAAAVRAALALRLESLAVEVTDTLAHHRWYANELCTARDAYFAWAAAPCVAAQVAALERGLSSTDPRARTLAINCTDHLARTPAGSPHVPLYRRALAAEDEKLRRTAATTLAKFGAREVADDLLMRARMGSPAEASSMIDALALLGDARVVEVALSRAGEVFAGAKIPDGAEPAWLCNSAVKALGCFIGSPAAFETLGRSLAHVEMRMRRDAATALGRAGDVRAVPLLEPLLKDPEKQVRGAAQTAITRLSSPSTQTR